MRSPMASPCHQANHVSAKRLAGSPPSHRLVTPIVALTAVLAIAARPMKPSTSVRRSSVERKPGMRRSAYQPTSASSVLPSAMPAATGTVAPAQRLTTTAPTATPGHISGPNSSNAASESPAGGQTTVAKRLTGSNWRPQCPTAT